MKLSIIIPVYNVDKYLENTLQSILNQTFQDYEIICVNDGSTDKSLEILQKYSQLDNRIKVYSTKNQGPGLARNYGLSLALGEYIHFFDSDDWLEKDAYEKIFKVINENDKPDIVHFTYKFVYPGSKKIHLFGITELTGKNLNIENTPDIVKIWDRYVWNKIYKSDFVRENNLLFNNYICYEDIEFSFNALINAKSIYFMEAPFLNYRCGNPNSLVSKYFNLIIPAYTSYQKSVNLSLKLKPDIREKILTAEFANLQIILYSCYKEKKISYKEFKNILSKIDYSIFSENSKKKGTLSNALDVLKYPEFIFKSKNLIKNFFKLYFAAEYSYLIKIKNYMLGIK